MNEGLNVLWETKTTETQSRFQKLGSDTRIKSHGMSYFLDVRSDTFAQIRDYVGITDFQREKRVRSVFN